MAIAVAVATYKGARIAPHSASITPTKLCGWASEHRSKAYL
jgi:hypothetical protein